TLATTHVQNGAGVFGPQQLVDPVADRPVVAAVEKGLTVRQHGRGIAGLATVLVLHQQQDQIALAGLVIAVAIAAGPGPIAGGQWRKAVRVVQLWQQAGKMRSVTY